MESSNAKLKSLMLQLHTRIDAAKLAFDEAAAELERQKAENDKRYKVKMDQLKEERRKWEAEKGTTMKSVASAGHIVNLNVGGEKISTSRNTLIQPEGSLLATMFSGDMDHKLQKDSNGNIFLDYDPVLFNCLLNQLRTWPEPSSKHVIRAPVGSEQPFFDLLHSLKIDERYIDRDRNIVTRSTTVSSSSTWQPEKLKTPQPEKLKTQQPEKLKTQQREQGPLRFWTTGNSEVQLTDDERTCEKISHGTYQSVFGTKNYSSGVHPIRLKLEQGSANVLMGICSSSKTLEGPVYYNTVTTHGWFVHGYVIVNGREPQPGWSQVNEHDVLELTINCEERSLSIYNERSGAQSSMDVNINEAPFPWCLLILFNLKHSRVALL